MKFSFTVLFSKCDQIRSFLRIWSHLLKKSVIGNFIFCAVNKINNVHLKALRTVYFDYKSTFQELLAQDASFPVHHRSIQTLVEIEIYKHIHSLLLAIMGEVLKINKI